ncbi:MAG: hypothetical protein IKE70_06600 [Bacilli bacterium]|nr:hypothetical protein [Bacilli bacterium]
MNKKKESIMYLYKSYLTKEKNEKFTPNKEALKKGIIINNNCSKSILSLAINTWGIDNYLLNQTFHKSFDTVVQTPIEELWIQQIIHYITTYGFEELDLYSKDTVYIPKEKLEVPDLKENIKLINITPITKEELKNKLWELLTSNIALSKKKIECIIKLVEYLDITKENINKVNNKEVKTALYDKLNIIPENNLEFLRYIIYKQTRRTLLIKDKETIDSLKKSNKEEALNLFYQYKDQYGLIPLSEIFNRFKKLFISLKTSSEKEIYNDNHTKIVEPYEQSQEELELNKIINKISKLSKKYHKPLKSNPLDNILTIDKESFHKLLEKESIWRIIKLKNYLSFMNNNITERVYKIRNGKVWITNNYKDVSVDQQLIDTLDNIIINKLKEKVFHKKIYLDDFLNLSLPTSEKQFVGNIPFSSKLSIDKDNILVGIQWFNVKDDRVDLDLKIISNEYTIGWDANYKSDDKLIFTGDVTDAPLPNGAAEYIYIDKSINNTIFSLKINNYTKNISDIEYNLVVAKAKRENIKNNYIVNPNDIIVKIPKNNLEKDKIEHSLGSIVIHDNKIELIFTDLTTSNNRTSCDSNLEEILRNYLLKENNNKCLLRNYLIQAGAIITEDKNSLDIDLSINHLNKNSLIELLK